MGSMEGFGFFLSRTFATTKATRGEWPFVPGGYIVLDPKAPVAVTTLGSIPMVRDVADAKPRGLCIVGKVETENIGIEKIIKNILSNPAIRYLVCAGPEPPKHLTGATLLALFKHGIDAAGRIPAAPGMRPQLPNTSREEVDAFRRQVEPVDLLGCTDIARISAVVTELADRAPRTPVEFNPSPDFESRDTIPRVFATAPDPERIKLDKGGYFVIQPLEGAILVEHYDYKDRLLRIIEGRDARTLYWMLINNGWVTRMDHAAYLGKELLRAELSQKQGFPFVQDAA